MNPEYLWLVDALQLLTIFLIGPALAIAIAYAARRGKPQNFSPDQNFSPEQYGMVCVASGISAVLLFVFAKWMNADVRTAQYFLQLAAVLLGGLLFGVCMGCGFPVLLHLWRWHRTTRLTDGNTRR
jgi:hypothetical protein